MSTGALRDDLATQARYVEPRCPVYARLLERISDELDRGLEAGLDEVWRGRSFGAWYERPLLVLAALRDDALREGDRHPLFAAIGVREPDLAAVTRHAVAAALAPERAHLWQTLRARYLQTNEPSRAAAWLWPAHLAWRASPERPIAIVDVGASAGLNLVADRVPGRWETQDGAPLVVAPLPPIAERVGYDLRPLDVLDEGDARWLRACVWPGQGDRESTLLSAIEAFRAARGHPDAPRLERMSAGEVPKTLPDDGPTRVLVYQSIMRDYLPAAERAAYEEGLRRWLERRAPASAIWIELEVTQIGDAGGPPATITAHVREPSGLLTVTLATCEPHPRRLEVDDAAVERLSSALRA